MFEGASKSTNVQISAEILPGPPPPTAAVFSPVQFPSANVPGFQSDRSNNQSRRGCLPVSQIQVEKLPDVCHSIKTAVGCLDSFSSAFLVGQGCQVLWQHKTRRRWSYKSPQRIVEAWHQGFRCGGQIEIRKAYHAWEVNGKE